MRGCRRQLDKAPPVADSIRAPEPALAEVAVAALDLKDIKGQETAKRALEVTAAGGHNLLMLFFMDNSSDME